MCRPIGLCFGYWTNWAMHGSSESESPRPWRSSSKPTVSAGNCHRVPSSWSRLSSGAFGVTTPRRNWDCRTAITSMRLPTDDTADPRPCHQLRHGDLRQAYGVGDLLLDICRRDMDIEMPMYTNLCRLLAQISRLSCEGERRYSSGPRRGRGHARRRRPFGLAA